MTRHLLRTSLLMMAVWFATLAPAHAQATFGLRAGLSADPDQFFIGGHVESPGLTQQGHLTFRPNAEVGFGSDQTLISGNLEFVYWVQYPGSQWSSYFGAGPSINFVHTDLDSRAHGGFSGLVGFQHRGGLFIEMKSGGGSAAGLKAMVGYVLKR